MLDQGVLGHNEDGMPSLVDQLFGSSLRLDVRWEMVVLSGVSDEIEGILTVEDRRDGGLVGRGEDATFATDADSSVPPDGRIVMDGLRMIFELWMMGDGGG